MPTIAQKVPRAAWAFAARRLKEAVRIPVIASNRINTPEVAEAILARGDADLVSMARPMLADPEFANKAREGRADEINVCIACNQACLDLIFSKRVATCLVNPKAGREIEFDAPAPASAKRVAVVGAGPAGLACAVTAAERGHARDALRGAGEDRRAAQPRPQRAGQGGVRRDAALLPAAASSGSASTCSWGERPKRRRLAAGGFDAVVVATGVIPAHARHSRASITPSASATSISSAARARRAAGRRHRRRRHRLRHRRVPHLGAPGGGSRAGALPGRVGRRRRASPAAAGSARKRRSHPGARW